MHGVSPARTLAAAAERDDRQAHPRRGRAGRGQRRRGRRAACANRMLRAAAVERRAARGRGRSRLGRAEPGRTAATLWCRGSVRSSRRSTCPRLGVVLMPQLEGLLHRGGVRPARPDSGWREQLDPQPLRDFARAAGPERARKRSPAGGDGAAGPSCRGARPARPRLGALRDARERLGPHLLRTVRRPRSGRPRRAPIRGCDRHGVANRSLSHRRRARVHCEPCPSGRSRPPWSPFSSSPSSSGGATG